jgi:histidinol-phosphate/aromatic aminotransferase/cobyric acid decarboxylase-like protein
MAGRTALDREFDKVRPPYNVSVLDEAAAEFALEHLEVLEAQAARLREDRDALLAALRRDPRRDGVPVARANFVLVRVADADGVAAAHARARRADQGREAHAPAAGRLPAPDGRHARRERRCSTRASLRRPRPTAFTSPRTR